MSFSGPFFLLGEQNLGLKKYAEPACCKKNSSKAPTAKQYLSFAIIAASHWLRKIYPLAIQFHHVRPRVLNLPASFECVSHKIQGYCLRAELFLGYLDEN